MKVFLSAMLPVFAIGAQSASAQTGAAARIAAGDRENVSRDPAAALFQYESALELEPASYPALWRASREAVDLGEVEKTKSKREQYYQHASEYARRAIAADPAGAEGYFGLSRALGRIAQSVSPKERVKYAADIRKNALRTLEIDPSHAGAMHVMGVWNAEVMRLNSFARVFAKTFVGGKVFDTASWAEATRYMEASVKADPARLVHHLDLARIYRDTDRLADAQRQYEAAIRRVDIDANDDLYRNDAVRELRALQKNR